MAGCGVGIKKVRPDSCEGVRADGRGGYLLSHFRSIIDVVRFNFSEWEEVEPSRYGHLKIVRSR